uniref:Uncharacterized protein n=1 Tax=Arundo donax TaxID=35708 RepID=A0A0A9EVI8_ARUDO
MPLLARSSSSSRSPTCTRRGEKERAARSE